MYFHYLLRQKPSFLFICWDGDRAQSPPRLYAHASGFGAVDSGLLELDAMFHVGAVPNHG
jgi:hypothetical protein